MSFIPSYDYVYEEKDPQMRAELMRQLCKRDLWFLARHVLGFDKLETETDIHLRLCAELSNTPKRYLILIPRDFFKTSLMMAKCIQVLCNDPSEEIGIGSDTEQRARERVSDLREMLKNPLLIELFPEIFYEDPERESTLWTKNAFNVKKPPRHEMRGGFRLASVTAFGFDPMPTGSHFSFVWIDDLENDDNSQNTTQIKKLNMNLSAFMPVLPPAAPIIITGTIWAGDGKKGTGPHSTYQTRKGWDMYKRAVRSGDGQAPNKPTFPTRHGEEDLEQKESDIGDHHLWGGQYLMRYVPRTSDFFFPYKESVFQTYSFSPSPSGGNIIRGRHLIPLDECAIYITVDPSGGADEAQATSRTDKVGWCVNAVSLDNMWHILDLSEAYLSDPEFIEHLFALYNKWKPDGFAIEKMPHLATAMRQAFLLRKQSLPLSELKPRGRRKPDRIRALKPLLPGIHLLELSGQDYYFRQYYTEIEHGDDAIDAAAYQVDIARAPTRAMLHTRKQERIAASREEEYNSLPFNEKREWATFLKMERDAARPRNKAQDEWADMYPGDDTDVQMEDPYGLAHLGVS